MLGYFEISKIILNVLKIVINVLTSLSVIKQIVCFEVEYEFNHTLCTVSAELVMDLKSSDDGVSKKAMEKADSFIAALEEPCRTKANSTKINTTPTRQDTLVKAYTLCFSRTEAQSHLLQPPCEY